MEELKKLYDVLVREGKYSKSFEEFQSRWSKDAAYKDKVYGVVTRDGLYSKDKDSFFNKYSATETAVKKKDDLESSTVSQERAMVSPSVPTSSDTEPIKEDNEEDYFTGGFGDVLRGFDNIVPLGIGDFVDDMARSVASGYRQGNVAQAADDLLLQGHKATPEQLQKFIDANKAAQQIKPSAEMDNYTKIYNEEGKGFWGVVKGLANNPSIIPEVLSSSLVSMATNTDALKAGASAIGAGATAGAISGAAITPEFAGAGALPGALSGATSAVPYAFGLASSVVEAGSTFAELLTEELKGEELTKENVKAILEDPEKLQSIRNKAITRGIVIGTLDALTGKLASNVGAKVLTKSAAKSATGAATRGAVVRSTALGAGIEAVGGSAGEAAARAAIGQDMDISEIALEGLAELPGGVRSTIQARLAKPSYKVNGQKVTASDIDNLIETMTPQQLAATNIVIDNDYEGRMFKIQDKVVTSKIKEEVRKANPNLNETSLNAITDLEKELQGLEGNKTQTGKDRASVLRNEIKDIQENQLQEVRPLYSPDEKIAKLEAELETITDDNNPRIAEIDAEISELETTKTKEDAVQEQSTTEIPVQSGTGTSKTMEGGTPKTEPEVTTEQTTQEEVTPSETIIEEQAVDTKPTDETPKAEPVKMPKNKAERKEAALKGDVVYHKFFESIIESTPEQYNNALKEVAETGAIENALNYGKAVPSRQVPNSEEIQYGPTLLNMKKEDADYYLKERTKEKSALEAAPTETPKAEAAPAEEKFTIDGKEYTKDEAIQKGQNNSRAPIYGSKMEYNGNDPDAKRFVEEYNSDSNPYNQKGQLKGRYMQQQILKALDEMNFRKFGNLYRKHIDPNFKRSMNEKAVGGVVGKNFSFRDLAGYRIGDASPDNFKDAEFRAFAKEAGISIPEQTTPKAEVKPVETAEPKAAPTKVSSEVAAILKRLAEAEKNRSATQKAYFDARQENKTGVKQLRDFNKAKKEVEKIEAELKEAKDKANSPEVAPSKKAAPAPTAKAEAAPAKPATEVNKSEEKVINEIGAKADNENNKLRKDISHESPKLEYDGDNESIKKEVERYDRLTRKVEEDGSFSNIYAYGLILKLIRRGLDTNNTRKLANALRKADLFNEYSRDIQSGNNFTTLISDSDELIADAYYRVQDKLEATRILTKLAKELGVEVASLETEANRKVEKIESKPKAEVTPAVTPKAEVIPAKSKEVEKIDKEIAQLEGDVNYYEMKIENIQEEIAIEQSNTKEGLVELKEKAKKEIEEVKKDKSLDKFEKIDKIEEIKYEIENFKEEQESIIESYKDDLKEAKSELRKASTKLNKLNEKKSQITPTETSVIEEAKGKIDELLELDPEDKGTLAKISSGLGDIINEFEKIEKNLGSNILLVPMKYVLKAIKGLVDAGMTLQEAIKKVAADENLKVKDIIKGINNVNEITKIAPAYNALMEKADKLIARQKSRGVDNKKIISNLDTMIRNSDVYKDENTNDTQRKIMELEARAKMGVAPRKAPSIGRVLGVLNDIKNVSREEKLKIISRIRELSRDAAKDLAEEIRGLASKGKITAVQAANIISRFGKVNMLNEMSVSNFVDYMAKVFADAEYDNKINIARGKLKNAKKNVNTKIGIADGLAYPLQTLLSINPTIIPIKFLDRYIELVDMFSERKAVLKLDEISEVTKDVNDILDEINNEQSLIPELTFRLNNSKNQVLKDGELDYAATIKKMIAEGEITQEEADLMVKYKNEINPREGKAKKTDAELEKEKKELVDGLKKSTINAADLPTRDERSIAKRIAEHLKKPFINQLSNTELINLVKSIDNINNGYLPHQALLILEKLDSFSDGKTEADIIEKASLATIAKIYNSVKGKLTKRDAVFEMIRRAPLFNIDQVLGNFKTRELFEALLGKSATGEARFSFELKTIEEKLKKAQDKVAKSFKLDPLSSTISSYKIKTYLIQLENDSNPGDPRVNPAAKYIEATIKHIKKLKSQYNENDVKILQDILDEFAPNGDIDINKLYNSFNSAEKNAIKTLQEIKKSESEKAEFTGAVIRGKRINPLNNHTHISVLSEDSKSDLDSGASFADDYNKSLNPSTKAKSLIERTPGVKPINFDAYSTAHKSAKYVLLDYYLTSPIRTARKSIRAAEIELEKNGEMSEEQRRIFNAVEDSFNTSVEDLVMNSYMQTSFGSDIVNYISKQGYRAVLAGLGRSGVELLSNIGFVVFDPFTFAKGVEYSSVILSEDGPAIMNNVGSVQTNRVYASGLSGRMIDTGILNQSIGTKSSKTQGKVINKAQQIWNLTGKKGLNAVELTADALITSPDKLVMRPYWMGSFAVEFEKQTGSKPDFKKIAENNEGYMNANEAAIKQATEVADKKSALMGATKNGFTGLLRGKTRAEDRPGTAILKNFNSFMTNFMIYEYTAAKTGVMAAVGQGTMTRSQGAAVLAGVITRMTVYNLLINAATAGVSGLIGLAFGGDDEEEEEKKELNQMVGQSLASTFGTLILGRDFGNISKTFINYGFEELVTKEYLEGLRTGEYDPYKDAILRTSLNQEETGEIKFYENIPNFLGSYSPMAKTTALAFKALTAPDKKEFKAIERQEKEKYVRLPLEILGNAGFVPLYKEVRKSVMDEIYKDLKGNGKVGISKEELKKTDPKMYKIMYGED